MMKSLPVIEHALTLLGQHKSLATLKELSHGLLVHGQEIDNDIHNVLMSS